MNIQNLAKEKIIGNIKTGTKGENGIPKKLPYFHVEEDKATSFEMVDIFKQLYPNNPTKLKIMFINEHPFSFKYKRYSNSKVVCIGNDTKAITVGKDGKGNNAQIEVDCNEECDHRKSGKCKLVGSLQFILIGIEAGGVWKLNTSGGLSLSNIASEIVKYKKAGMSIANVPFELSLTPQESLAYGIYYSLDLHRLDIKPQLTGENELKVLEEPQETKNNVLPEASKSTKKTTTKKEKESEKKKEIEEKNADQDEKKQNETETKNTADNKEKPKESKEDFSNYLVIQKFMPTMIGTQRFDKVICEDINRQEVEYIIHPNADESIIKCGPGSIIELVKAKIQEGRNVLCTYKIIKMITPDGEIIEQEPEELKKAV